MILSEWMDLGDMVMSTYLLLWRGYRIYFYDEEDGRDYVGDFMDKLAQKDPQTACEIFSGFFERIEKGTGLPEEWAKGKNPRLKKIQNDFWEYRHRSKRLRKIVRIYFGVDEKARTIILLNAHFKKGKKDQDREVATALKRFNKYKCGR